jgi:hypothetical protein
MAHLLIVEELTKMESIGLNEIHRLTLDNSSSTILHMTVEDAKIVDFFWLAEVTVLEPPLIRIGAIELSIAESSCRFMSSMSKPSSVSEQHRLVSIHNVKRWSKYIFKNLLQKVRRVFKSMRIGTLIVVNTL